LLYASEWSDEENAKKIFEAYGKVLKTKWKNTTFSERTGKVLRGTGDDGAFQVVLSGRKVTSVEGLKTLDEVVRQIN
jgi:hypothetical protein